MHLVVPFGFYGCGNIGDEATLQGFARLLRRANRRISAAIASRNPSHTAAVEPAFSYFNCNGHDPRRWWAKLRASAHVFAGGTPIMDVLGDWPLCEVLPLIRSAHARHKRPIVFVGIGTEGLRQEQSRRIVSEEIAPCVRHWSVRSERDRDRLVEYGVAPDAITIAADMAWLIEPASPHFGLRHIEDWGLDAAKQIIGVNLVNEGDLLNQRPQITQELARCLDELIESRDAGIVFLANEVRDEPCFDMDAARLVIDRMEHKDAAVLAPNVYHSPVQMMSIIACCDLTISMRYHFCLFSAIQDVPFVALTRSDKVADLCWDLDWSARIEPAAVNADDLLTHIDGALGRATVSDRVTAMRHRAERNLIALDSLWSDRSVRREASLV